MAYSVKIIKDSVTSVCEFNYRLTTMEVTIPRLVLSEFNTHRSFSRNSASSRAIPVEKQIAKVLDDPFIPVYWGKNQKGMQADQELSFSEIEISKFEWLYARDEAVKQARKLLAIGVHKQITNRLLEPWMWQTIIVTATEWNNFFALRTHKDAQPEIRKGAIMMKEAYDASIPKRLNYGDWHLPLLQDDEFVLSDDSPEWNESQGFSGTMYTLPDAQKISAGRCARISYLTHVGTREPSADIELCTNLIKSGHMSPLEHVATPMDEQSVKEILCDERIPFCGNFRGWVQLRKQIENEDDYSKILK